MKKILLVIFITGVLFDLQAQNVPFTVNFIFKNIIDGYDHTTKTQVFIDDVFVGESKEVKETEGASFTVDVSKGSHQLKIVNLALYRRDLGSAYDRK